MPWNLHPVMERPGCSSVLLAMVSFIVRFGYRSYDGLRSDELAGQFKHRNNMALKPGTGKSGSCRQVLKWNRRHHKARQQKEAWSDLRWPWTLKHSAPTMKDDMDPLAVWILCTPFPPRLWDLDFHKIQINVYFHVEKGLCTRWQTQAFCPQSRHNAFDIVSVLRVARHKECDSCSQCSGYVYAWWHWLKLQSASCVSPIYWLWFRLF